ncbi:MAG: 34-kDa subunit of RNA polymerase III (C) [Candelina submexicana]|nr:MAG: 34-kDa subunit of RNA polymerase III (C) [Candelina submexicana]
MASSFNSASSSSKELQHALYSRCAQGPANALYYQDDLLEFDVIPGNSISTLLQCVQGLMNDGLLKVHTHDGLMAWKVVKPEDAAREKSLSQEETMILSHIRDTQREGIWTTTLRRRVNLHLSIVTRCLRTLESKNFIKAIKNVKYPARKIYILASLNPSEDVTGGPWFTDGELDTNFIDYLADWVQQYITARSWVQRPAIMVPKKAKMNKTDAEKARARALEPYKHLSSSKEDLLPLPPGFRDYPEVKELTKWINKSGVASVTLAEVDVTQLLDVMGYDGRIDKVFTGSLGGPGYRTRRQAHPKPEEYAGTGLTESPCGVCPVFNLCEEGGPVSASNCKYFEEWLDI